MDARIVEVWKVTLHPGGANRSFMSLADVEIFVPGTTRLRSWKDDKRVPGRVASLRWWFGPPLREAIFRDENDAVIECSMPCPPEGTHTNACRLSRPLFIPPRFVHILPTKV